MTARLDDGFYWCSHDTNYVPAADGALPFRWNVVEIGSGLVYRPGDEHPTPLVELPIYVRLIGPVEAPKIEFNASGDPYRTCIHCFPPVHTDAWNCPQCGRPLKDPTKGVV